MKIRCCCFRLFSGKCGRIEVQPLHLQVFSTGHCHFPGDAVDLARAQGGRWVFEWVYHIYICMYVYIYVYMYTLLYIYISAYTRMYICVYVYIFIHVYVHVYAYVYVYVYVYMCVVWGGGVLQLVCPRFMQFVVVMLSVTYARPPSLTILP